MRLDHLLSKEPFGSDEGREIYSRTTVPAGSRLELKSIHWLVHRGTEAVRQYFLERGLERGRSRGTGVAHCSVLRVRASGPRTAESVRRVFVGEP